MKERTSKASSHNHGSKRDKELNICVNLPDDILYKLPIPIYFHRNFYRKREQELEDDDALHRDDVNQGISCR